VILVVMGVCGAGKTTLAKALAEELGWSFAEGDDFHPLRNVEKMRGGQPLGDDDRWPWLDAINARARAAEAKGENLIVTCSALKASYRARLRAGVAGLRFLHLTGTEPLLRQRLESRRDHYMPATLLDSQLATLEAPDGEADVVSVSSAAPPAAVLAEAIEALNLREGKPS
jgi:gluconokinase